MPKAALTSANSLVTFAPSDSTDLAGGPCLGFAVATAGVYVVTFTDDPTGTATQVACSVGFNRYSVKRIWATGSAATVGVMPLY